MARISRCSVDGYVLPSRVDRWQHLSTRQYARLVDELVEAIGLPPEEYETHSLRRTKASIIYKATRNIRVMQILPGHSKIENTVRYLGVDIEDALALAEKTKIWLLVDASVSRAGVRYSVGGQQAAVSGGAKTNSPSVDLLPVAISETCPSDDCIVPNWM